jgi:hypothetical protein
LVATLTTVGYGDLHPTSDGTRIFTIIYILTGLGVLVACWVRSLGTTSALRPRAGIRESV